MEKTILEGRYKSVHYKYTPHDSNDGSESNGILQIEINRGNKDVIESTHIIKNWAVTRIFQYIASMENLV